MEFDSSFSSTRYSVLWAAEERERWRDFLLGLRTISIAEGPEPPLEEDELRAREWEWLL